MNNFLLKAIYQFAGSGNHRAVSSRNKSSPSDLPATVMVSLNPSNSTKNDLASQGYTNTRVFFPLPSLTSPRWLFPLGNGRCAHEGLQIYKPYAKAARMLKGLLTTMVVAHCSRFAPHRVLVASRGPLPLEALVREVTAECQPVFALSLGTEMRFRKLTVQVMRPDGEILDTSSSRSRTRRSSVCAMKQKP